MQLDQNSLLFALPPHVLSVSGFTFRGRCEEWAFLFTMDTDFKSIRAGLHDTIRLLSRDNLLNTPSRTSLNIARDCSRSIDSEIKRLLHEVSALHQQKNKMDKLISDTVRAYDDYKERQYEARRKAADIAISKEPLRIAIFSRDGWVCVKCKSKDMLSIDHIVPIKAGGGDELENLQTLCKRCNSSKGSKMMEEWK